MDITRRCDYACRILRAAYRNGDERMSVAELAEREGIPYAFARSIQHDLTKCGFVNTTRRFAPWVRPCYCDRSRCGRGCAGAGKRL